MSTPATLSDIMTNIINAIAGVLGAVATAIADNAAVIGTILVVGALAVAIMAFGSRVFRGLSTWFRGIF